MSRHTTVAMVAVLFFAAAACGSGSPTGLPSSTVNAATTPSPPGTGLYALDVGTGEATLFLEPPDGVPEFALNEFVLSPDAALLAFEAGDADSHAQIYVMNADGTDLHQLTHELSAGSPAWSPDGSKIALIALAPDATFEVYTADVASGKLDRITREDRDVSEAPSWSPDGTAIAFQVGEPPVIRSVDIATGKTATIVRNAGLPDISPDGTRLAFNTWSVAKVTLSDIDGSGRTMIPSDVDECCAKWSPDGGRIAFQGGGEDVDLFDVSSGERRVVGAGALVDWLDDGTLLVQR